MLVVDAHVIRYSLDSVDKIASLFVVYEIECVARQYREVALELACNQLVIEGVVIVHLLIFSLDLHFLDLHLYLLGFVWFLECLDKLDCLTCFVQYWN